MPGLRRAPYGPTCQGPQIAQALLMLMCRRDGRHFRAFVNDQAYVRGVLDRLESQTRLNSLRMDQNIGSAPVESSGAHLERHSEDVKG